MSDIFRDSKESSQESEDESLSRPPSLSDEEESDVESEDGTLSRPASLASFDSETGEESGEEPDEETEPEKEEEKEEPISDESIPNVNSDLGQDLVSEPVVSNPFSSSSVSSSSESSSASSSDSSIPSISSLSSQISDVSNDIKIITKKSANTLSKSFKSLTNFVDKSVEPVLAEPGITHVSEKMDMSGFSKELQEEQTNLETEFQTNKCDDILNTYNKTCNNIIKDKELNERKLLETDTMNTLYPTFNDPNFNAKISANPEFKSYPYNGEINNIREYSDHISSLPFELAPHQYFVKNFLSYQTPYNSLLLFHGLGTGKTCSAIGVAEEERDYMKSIGIMRKIIIVASPNVQTNFRSQLFNERDLKNVNGIWSLKTCIGDKLLHEINPTRLRDIPKEKIVVQIKSLIYQYYDFMGYSQFAGYIDNIKKVSMIGASDDERKRQSIYQLQKEFNGRLVIIDEIHNVTDDENMFTKGETKSISKHLMELVKTAKMRMLLLTATPMFNSYKSIIWILNLMNINDKRSFIQIGDVFDKNGDFIEGDETDDKGKNLLIRKSIGYVSYVRGDNPYVFPFRVYPTLFSPYKTFSSLMDLTPNQSSLYKYPSVQLNGKPITQKLDILSLYLNEIGDYQSLGYSYIIESLNNRENAKRNKFGKIVNVGDIKEMDKFNYTILQIPLEALNIVYPLEELTQFYQTEATSEASSEASSKVSSSLSSLESLESLSKSSTEGSSTEGSSSTGSTSPNSIRIIKKASGKRRADIASAFKSPVVNLPTNSPFSSFDNLLSSIKPSNKKTIYVGGDDSSVSVSPDISDISEVSVESEVFIEPSKKYYINPHLLTGKEGLKRTMNYTENDAVKGNFEYKSIPLFSPQHIGQYSNKIKSIIDNIVNPNGMISDGIILIYSQYIDAGLVPMALALEEAGFSRHGKSKSLFKTTPNVEGIYSQVRQKRLKYIMITGDKRLSPNIPNDLNDATDSNNKDGKIVKVVLISSAGSEGLDFKCIRQIHIMEPWYNVNKIEQIIGRGVRNFSHKSLPFEQRNVQIFLYGTILKTQEVESVDLYIYRLAEKKAIQIGKVSRLLKENSVDCQINQGQTQFSYEKFKDQQITQILSNGTEIPNFPVGDIPYSAVCDFQQNCEYSCISQKEFPTTKHFNETFLLEISKEISNHISRLFREKSFYTSDELLQLLKPKYEDPQIYYTLTKMMDDKYVIYDKYDRPGRVMNASQFYLFQPIELQSVSSFFETNHPVDVKQNEILFDVNNVRKANIDEQYENELKELEEKEMEYFTEEELGDTEEFEKATEKLANIVETIIDTKRKPRKEHEKGKEVKRRRPDILKEIEDNYNIAKEVAEHEDLDGEGWYKKCGIAMRYLYTKKVPSERLYFYLLSHIVDTLFFEDKLLLLNYLYISDLTPFEKKVKRIFDENIIVKDGVTGIILFDKTKREVLIFTDRWEKAAFEDLRILEPMFQEKYNLTKIDFAKFVGFIDYDIKKNLYLFKVKDVTRKRFLGARCDEAGKAKTIELLNTILEREEFTKDNTKGVKQTSQTMGRPALTQDILCIIQEFYMRYFETTKKDGQSWFLNTEDALMYNITQLHIEK